MTVADLFCRGLAAGGVTTLWGLPGTTTLAALDAVRRHGRLRFVVCRHEQGAAHMADAAARLGRRLGVALVDLGPGLANTATAVLAAARDSSPLLVVAGNEERWLIGREVWHEMRELDVFGGLTKLALRVPSAEAFPRLFRQAVTTALSGRPGPVLLSVPKDLWTLPVEDEGVVGLPLTLPRVRPRPRADELDQALVHLRSAERPVLLAGGGVRRSGAEAAVRQAAERLRLPVVTSPNGRGALPEDHDLCLGHAGRFGHAVASRVLREADLVLAVGCRLDDLTTHNWALLSSGQVVLQVDIEGALLGANWPVAVGIVADARSFLEDLAAADGPLAKAWDVAARIEERRRTRAAYYAIADRTRVKPQAVMAALERHAPPDHTLVMGGGRHQQFVGEWLARGPDSFLYGANSGVMGFAFPAAIAASLLHPARLVLACLGDGDFLMCVQELETAVREGARVKCVILNDFAYGAMKVRQEVPFGTTYANPSFEALAAAFGAAGRTVTRGAEVEEAVAWLLAQEKVALLDVHIDLDENRSLLYGHDIGDRRP